MTSNGRGIYALPSSAVGVNRLIVLGNCPIFAQGVTPSITGTVKNMSGTAVEGAAVSGYPKRDCFLWDRHQLVGGLHYQYRDVLAAASARPEAYVLILPTVSLVGRD
jgi:hypothetical protein